MPHELLLHPRLTPDLSGLGQLQHTHLSAAALSSWLQHVRLTQKMPFMALLPIFRLLCSLRHAFHSIPGALEQMVRMSFLRLSWALIHHTVPATFIATSLSKHHCSLGRKGSLIKRTIYLFLLWFHFHTLIYVYHIPYHISNLSNPSSLRAFTRLFHALRKIFGWLEIYL